MIWGGTQKQAKKQSVRDSALRCSYAALTAIGVVGYLVRIGTICLAVLVILKHR